MAIPNLRNSRNTRSIAVALLGGCVVVLIGVARGLDPDVILVRAAGSAALLAVAAWLFQRSMN
jgi:hypothetical protein